MKIIQFVPSLGNGGGEALVRDYAIALKKKGHDVKIMVMCDLPDTSNEKVIKANNIPLISLEPPFGENGRFIGRLTSALYRHLWLIKYLNAEKPDIVHVHLTLLHVLHICHRFIPYEIRIVYTCHSIPEIYFEKYKKEFTAVKYFLKRGNFKLIGLHEEAAMQMKDIFQSSNITYLHNMINLERFCKPIVSREDMRQQLGIPQDAFVIGHVGRFAKVKNHDFLIEIFASVINRNPNAFLLMIGDGDLKVNIETRLKEMRLDNRYLILSNRYDIPELNRTMDVFVFPSRYEGFATALLEAQVCGVKCVCSDNVPAAVLLNENVYILSLKDPIEKWRDAVLYNYMSPNVSKIKIEDYDTTAIIEKLEQIYRG